MSDDTKQTPRLEISIELDSDGILGMHSFIAEIPWFGFVDGWDGFEATLIESDGATRDVKKEAYEGTGPHYVDLDTEDD